MRRNKIRGTDIYVTPICFGTSPLGDMPDTYGYRVSQQRAIETIKCILKSPVNFVDTSRNYGMGRSEERLGLALKEKQNLSADLIISSKLDRDMKTNVFDFAQARKSFEQSLNALKVEQIPILHLHDPEYALDLKQVTSKGGALDFLFSLKEERLVKAVGLAMGRLEIMEPLLKERPFDTLISHNRFTILNRQADKMFDYAYKRGITVFNAAPYAGGILAKGSSITDRLVYQKASKEKLKPVYEIEKICKKYNIPVGAVALQFSIKDKRITSTIVGVSKPDRIKETLAWANLFIPEEAWAEIRKLPYAIDDPEAGRVYKPC